MQLPSTLAWLVDAAGASPAADRFLAELGARQVHAPKILSAGKTIFSSPVSATVTGTWAPSTVRSGAACASDWRATSRDTNHP